jgi:hypothetical protein
MFLFLHTQDHKSPPQSGMEHQRSLQATQPAMFLARLHNYKFRMCNQVPIRFAMHSEINFVMHSEIRSAVPDHNGSIQSTLHAP